ncbi:DEKNAAC102998 [Brettanomyces naardenensis]|uniref:methylated diphthine methylhydrolase n=1 Tax=Brettanomyces naardenensis TaxID=13370 RepID=A0A448YMC1_BRENA|nr:DEKNAAC102998 [Brettanomyces naardenensis]
MAAELNRLAVFKTDLPPCCLRIYKDVIYLGTYKLVEGDNRYGSIEIWQQNALGYEKVKEYPTKGAILDLKMDPFEEGSLCSCHSKGNFIIWKIDPTDPTVLTEQLNVQAFDEKTLITAVNYHTTIPHQLVLTTTTGLCAVYDLSSGELTTMETSHDLECWYADFCSQPGLEHLVISGGDDRKMIIHDVRNPEVAIYSNDTFHEAGVVSILPSSKSFCSGSPYTVWSGSYDDHVRSIDLRYIPGEAGGSGSAFPRVIQNLDLGGGVWKLIPSPRGDGGDNRVLSCCMYDGARILSYDQETGDDIKVENYFKGDHSSICYGGDWKGDRVATCSFYDEVVQVWAEPVR